MICPIGGGGLIAGIATAVKARKPECRIIGVQSKQMDAAYRSFKTGEPVKIGKRTTIADGIAIKSPSNLTFSIIKSLVDDVMVVEEEEIARAMLLLLERCKSVIEGAGAVTLAALLRKNTARKGEKVALIASGGNVDITILSKIITQGLIKSGRYREVKVLVEDKPGGLEALLRVISEAEANIVNINFDRYSPDVPFNHVAVEVAMETRNREHSEIVLEEIKKWIDSSR